MARAPDIDWFIEEYRNHQKGLRDKEWPYYSWITFDRPIRTAFKEHPGHSDWSEVYAKVALVNRAYNAQLGRGKMDRYDAEDAVTKALCESASDIDGSIMKLLRNLDTLNEAVLPKVLECHDRIVTIVRRGSRKYELSFSSKYLSFHFPEIVPILDSRAEWTAANIKGMSSFRGCGRYEKHCRRILSLMDCLLEKKIKPELKMIDYVLFSGV
jgi:hypothetical protein